MKLPRRIKLIIFFFCNLGARIDYPSFEKIYMGTNQDIRQVLNNLQMWSLNSRSLSYQDVKKK